MSLWFHGLYRFFLVLRSLHSELIGFLEYLVERVGYKTLCTQPKKIPKNLDLGKNEQTRYRSRHKHHSVHIKLLLVLFFDPYCDLGHVLRFLFGILILFSAFGESEKLGLLTESESFFDLFHLFLVFF